MSEFKTIDRQGRLVTVIPLDDGRAVAVYQDGWKERREIIDVQNKALTD